MSPLPNDKDHILSLLPLEPLNLDYLHIKDKVQLLSYLNVMFASIGKRLEYVENHGTDRGYPFITYEAPSGRETSDEEALSVFEILRDERLFFDGKNAELATEVVHCLKMLELIDP
ncbi:hypothetical protein EG329_014101 [Mollisiaceae sp. DMI_Dod_QoI]|nr:hypothetical protein EG329_014101 [Helotiales sp. DMI_Dod_QoI]